MMATIFPYLPEMTLCGCAPLSAVKQGLFALSVLSAAWVSAGQPAFGQSMASAPLVTSQLNSAVVFGADDEQQDGKQATAEKPVRITISRDRSTGLFHATINGSQLQARELSFLEKAAQKAYPKRTIQLVDARTGYTVTMPRTMLGVILQPISGLAASQLNIPDGQAIVIDECFPGLPADDARLKKFDIILSCDGKRPITKKDFTQILNRARPSDRLNLIILRNGQEVEIEVPLIAYDPITARRLGKTDSSSMQGMRFDPLGAGPGPASNRINAGASGARENMNRLMVQLGDKGQMLPMEMNNPTGRSSAAFLGARTSDLEARIGQIQKQLSRIEQLLGMMLHDQYEDSPLLSPVNNTNGTPSNNSIKK